MKKELLLFVLLFISTLPSFSQSETLFSDVDEVVGFGGPIVEFSAFKGEVVPAVGGGGGVFLNDFFIGGYGIGGLDFRDPSIELDNYRMKLNHGGFWLGYNHNQDKVLHFYGSAKLGWGGIDVKYNGAGERPNDNVFVIQPEAGVEVNLFRWFKLVGTVGYRAVTGVNEIETQNNSDFSGITGALTFRFGWFD